MQQREGRQHDHGDGSTRTSVVGQRFLCDDGSRGTVVWAGNVRVKGVEEPWLGVEWDELTRGKSNGSVEGVQYFEPHRSDASYSFLKEHRIKTGISFGQALKEKYAAPSVDDELGVVMFGARQEQRVTVELVGKAQVEERLAHLDSLQVASLQDSLVSYWGGFLSMAETPINLTELDLTNTLISDWNVVADMLKQLPKLEKLYLGNNRFPSYPDLGSVHYDFSLRSLTLNGTKTPWRKAVDICRAFFPQLEELHLCGNGIKALDGSDQEENSETLSMDELVRSFSALRLLNLEDNSITSWEHVLLLSSLPRLETLVLNENNISNVALPGGKAQPFTHLKSISLDHNNIANWASVDELNKLSELQAVRVRWNPIYEDSGPAVGRMIAIARIAKIQTLNGSAVTPDEREESEKYYLKQIYHPEEDESTRSVHPRYAELLARYGQPTTMATASGPQTIAENMISVTLRSMVLGQSDSVVECVRNVPADMTVLNLRRLCHQLFGLGQARTSLSMRNPAATFAEPLDDLRELSTYGAQDGCLILVTEQSSRAL